MDALWRTDAHAEEPVADPEQEDSEAGQALALLQGEAGDGGGEQQACNRPGSGPPLDGLRCLDPSHPDGCRWCVAAPLPSRGLFSAGSHRADAFSLGAPLLPHRPPGASPPLPGGRNICTDWWVTRARKTARLLSPKRRGWAKPRQPAPVFLIPYAFRPPRGEEAASPDLVLPGVAAPRGEGGSGASLGAPSVKWAASSGASLLYGPAALAGHATRHQHTGTCAWCRAAGVGRTRWGGARRVRGHDQPACSMDRARPPRSHPPLLCSPSFSFSPHPTGPAHG